MVTILMSIGYASINSVIIGLNGEVIAKKVDGIFITDVNYVSDVDADLNNSKILNAYQTNLNSSVVLSNTNKNSSITYEITIKNTFDYDYIFNGVEYIEEDYSNGDISYMLTGMDIGDVLGAGDSLTFTIIFHYKDYVLSSNNNLDSLINFDFSIKPYVVAEYDYSGSPEVFVVPHDGVYKLEVWGAQGGSTGGKDTLGVYHDYIGGKGGYSSGLIKLNSGQNLFVVVGGAGTGSCVEEYCIGGYNGGGNSGVSTEDTKNYTCSGGGATHIALSNRGILSNYLSYQSEVLIVAGGGGGGYYHDFGELHSNFGGAGGGLNGVDGTLSGYTINNVIVLNATGGSQTEGGIGGYRGANGSFGQGGSGASCDTTDCGSSGGGGGWYGGGAAGHSGSGGGSGYISNLIDAITIDGTKNIPTYDGMQTMIGNIGNGYAKITYLREE